MTEFNKTLEELWNETADGTPCMAENKGGMVFEVLGMASEGDYRSVGLRHYTDGATTNVCNIHDNPVWREYTPPAPEKIWYKLAWVETPEGPRRFKPTYWHTSKDEALNGYRYPHGPMLTKKDSEWETE